MGNVIVRSAHFTSTFYYAKTALGVRPSLYLKSNIALTGNGTNDENIYKIVS